MGNYMLARHVCWCAIEDGVVFLDLKTQKYVGLDRYHSDLLYKIVRNGFSTPPPSPEKSDVTAENALTTLLLAEGLVTHDATLGKLLLPLSIDTVGDINFPERTTLDTRFRRIHIFRLMTSFLAVKYQLRIVPFERIVREAQARTPERMITIAVSDNEVIRLVRFFRRLRSIFYTAHNNCVLDSLVLRDFLYRNGVSSTWVIGVESRPFAAHSWIQHRGIVLNDYLEHVQRFTPILAV